jgi:hypothetical protein
MRGLEKQCRSQKRHNPANQAMFTGKSHDTICFAQTLQRSQKRHILETRDRHACASGDALSRIPHRTTPAVVFRPERFRAEVLSNA